MTADAISGRAPRQARGGVVLGMLCFVYVLNFLDRQLVSILAKPIQDGLNISDSQLGLITGLYFAMFYCFIAIPVGWLADRTNRVKHPTYDTARTDVFDYIERFHNPRMRRRLVRQDLKFASFSEPSAEMG